jgi:hypothetical protein
MMERKLHRLATVTRFRAHFKVLARFEKRAQATPHDRMVVGKQNADHICSAPSRPAPEPRIFMHTYASN